MNKIEVKSNTTPKEIHLEEDSVIFYENCNCKVNYQIKKDIKIFECIINSKIKSVYDTTSNMTLNIFSIDSSLDITINLNKENINLNYAYSTLNENDNDYKINIMHNYKKQKSKINNNGINLKTGKLDFLINVKVPKESSNITTNQNSKIITIENSKSLIKPNLLIDNYDVEANHSAYIGDFKPNDLFYLTSRGITLKSARKLLAKSFLIGNMDISFREIDIILDKLNKNWR